MRLLWFRAWKIGRAKKFAYQAGWNRDSGIEDGVDNNAIFLIKWSCQCRIDFVNLVFVG
jgi:hypothetical protein